MHRCANFPSTRHLLPCSKPILCPHNKQFKSRVNLISCLARSNVHGLGFQLRAHGMLWHARPAGWGKQPSVLHTELHNFMCTFLLPGTLGYASPSLRSHWLQEAEKGLRTGCELFRPAQLCTPSTVLREDIRGHDTPAFTHISRKRADDEKEASN